MNSIIGIKKRKNNSIEVLRPYNPVFVEKNKTIIGRKWYPEREYLSFPNTDGILEEILKVFEGEEIHLDKDLYAKKDLSPLAGDGRSATYDFQSLRRELLSRKYSCKIVKAYVYCSRDFLGFNDHDIKDYLLYLAEVKQSPVSTLNQAMNALKFYYGTMLKRKFIYGVKRHFI